MSGEIKRENWDEFFRAFSNRNQLRSTKLEYFSNAMGAQEEERFLTLSGITLDLKAQNIPCVEIMLGGSSASDQVHLNHTISHVARVLVKQDEDGRDDALEVVDSEGNQTLLRFVELKEVIAST